MKMLLIGIDHSPMESANDETLTHVAWLMQTGSYGIIADASESATVLVLGIGEQIARAGKRVQTAHLNAQVADGLQQARDLLQNPEYDCILILVENVNSPANFDAALGALLESSNTPMSVLMIYGGKTLTQFVLVTPDGSLVGEIQNIFALDFAPTLLALGGDTVPEFMNGKSFAARQTQDTGVDGYSSREEEIIRERLTGLGYI